jgi:hypothetical protein
MIAKTAAAVFDAYGKGAANWHEKIFVTKNLGPNAITVLAAQES